MSINVAVVDDQDIIQMGVQQSLTDVPPIIFIGGYSNLGSFFQSAVCSSADVVLLDDSLPDTEPLEAVQMLQAQCVDAAIILLGTRLTPHSIHQAIQIGASGVICKKEQVKEVLATGIRYAYAGRTYLSPHAALIASRIGQVPALSHALYEVLKLIADGARMPQIARTLDISRGAAYRRRDRLKEILEVDTNEQIVAEAIRRGLLSADE